MQDSPTPIEILDIVTAFLRDELVPVLPPREAFDARVAANALELVRRQISEGPAREAAEQARLEALLGKQGPLEALNSELAKKIADGAVDTRAPEVFRHLWQTTLDKLAIDQPRYAAYQRSAKEWTAFEEKEKRR
ncbi:MAG: DUF6285 domain-containing protein [Hyphomonadaceae bacterium]